MGRNLGSATAAAGADPSGILQYFGKGAEVEISINEPDFRNSWFEATVLRPADSEFSEAWVEYKTLLDDKEEGPLRELVRLVDMRPAQPRENRPAFNFSDYVDVIHNDGWWEGYITGVLEGNKYKVYFRGTKEEEEFPPSKLRPHHEWVKGRWIPPLDPVPITAVPEIERIPSSSVEDAKIVGIEHASSSGDCVEAIEKVTGDIFKQGDPVEAIEEVTEDIPRDPMEAIEEVTEDIFKPGGRVEAIEEVTEHVYKPGDFVEASSDEAGFEGAWCTGMVIEETTPGKYLVEYQTLRTEDDTGLLREEVDRAHLRPNPPEVRLVDSFVKGEQVDAWYTECWWEGVIMKVHKNSWYTVYFENADEKIKFEQSDLRVRQEWKNGKWHVAK